MERQTNQPVADALRHRQIPFPAAKLPTHIRYVQRQVMKYAINSTVSQVGNEFLANLQAWHQQIEHVIGLFTVIRDMGQLDVVCCSPILQAGLIQVPDISAMSLDLFALFQLGVEE